ncbi:MAG: riboflavin synthase [Gammaproteobacteria bacterium]|nr:riboflavin synthase [Gammaproteobacteria bacterium]
MFTGLIEYLGKVVANQQQAVAHRLEIASTMEGLCPGDSIAVQGVCLTVVDDPSPHWVFDVSPETLACTTLGSLVPGDAVHLERAMHAERRFGGHYVSGHVDGTACLQARRNLDDYIEMVIGGFAECDMIYLLPKGSITLNGVSLTINTVEKDQITVLLVPHTIQHTMLDQLHIGDALNVEFDYLARIISHQVKKEFERLQYDKSI